MDPRLAQLKIRILKDSDRSFVREHAFHQDVVSIGREAEGNLVHLPDNDRVVSKKHARIERKDGAYVVVDLHSTNATYLNENRLDPDRPYPLAHGDRVKIGEFVLEVILPQSPPPVVEAPTQHRTVAKAEQKIAATVPPVPSPVTAPAEQVPARDGRVQELEIRIAGLARDNERLRADMKKQQEAVAGMEQEAGRLRGEAQRLQAQASRVDGLEKETSRLRQENERINAQAARVPALEKDLLAARGESASLKESVARLRTLEEDEKRQREENSRLHDLVETLQSAQGPEVAEKIAQLQGSGTRERERMHAVLDVLLGTMLKLVRGRENFRREFLSTTIIQRSDSRPLYEGTTDEAKQFLLDAGISDQHAKDRAEMLSFATRDVLVHMVGLLDGYRRSVEEGSKRLLQKIDPETTRQSLKAMSLKLGSVKIPYKYLPVFFEWQLLQQFRKKYRDVQEEDRGVIEKRDFRPGFIKGYESQGRIDPSPERDQRSSRR